MWQFFVGMIVGAVIAIALLALISGAPDPEDDRGGFEKHDED